MNKEKEKNSKKAEVKKVETKQVNTLKKKKKIKRNIS